ncbi:MAG: Gfo/Idh/MocA family oxidoreductase [Chloroflexota bacterium]
MTSEAQGVLRWGVLSTADIAVRRVIPAMREARGNDVVALASRSQERADAVGSALDIPRRYGRYEDLLRDPEVDAVYVPLPNSVHAEWTIRAAEAGKHVLCEKPMARTVDECQAMIDACRSAGVRFMEGFMYRFHPQHAYVRDLIASGAIGNPTLIRSAFCVRMQRPPEDIRFAVELGGGALFDVGVYAIDAARWLAGAPLTSAVGQVVYGDSGTDTSATASLVFDNGVIASASCSFVAAGGSMYEIMGPLGRITVHGAFTQPPGLGPVVSCETADGVREKKFTSGINAYALMIEAYARAAVDNTEMQIPEDNGAANIAVIRALLDA